MKKVYLVFIIFLILAFLSGLLISKWGFTGKVVQENEYSWTKAICNSGKCIDVEITCKNGQVAGLKPVSDIIELSNLPVNYSDNLC